MPHIRSNLQPVYSAVSPVARIHRSEDQELEPVKLPVELLIFLLAIFDCYFKSHFSKWDELVIQPLVQERKDGMLGLHH